MRWCRDIADRLSLRSRVDKLWVVGRSPDSRLDESELPSRISQWPISLELSALTVAGPCRIFTGFPITPTVAGYKLSETRKSRSDCGRQYTQTFHSSGEVSKLLCEAAKVLPPETMPWGGLRHLAIISVI